MAAVHFNAPKWKFPRNNIHGEVLLLERVTMKVDNAPPKGISLNEIMQSKNVLQGKLPAKSTLPRSTPAFWFFILACFLLNLQLATCVHPSALQTITLTDTDLQELVQKQTFRYFWDYGHPVSGLARERTDMGFGNGEVVTIGGSGFGLMSIVVAASRGWVTRQAAALRVDKILQFLAGKAVRFNGVFPHWMNGTSGEFIQFEANNNAGDLVETSFMIQALLTVRQYFNVTSNTVETRIRSTADQLWKAVQWTWYMPEGEQVLTWGDPHQPGYNVFRIVGWNECLITYVLAAASPTYPIDAEAYHQGWAKDGGIQNGKQFYGIGLPLGEDYGGPLFFAHYSFLGLDPRGLKDQYADYWAQNVNHSLINYEHCVVNPNRFKGYSSNSWGLTASDSPGGYVASSPTNDVGTIAPTAALSSMPYVPDKSNAALQHFYNELGSNLWGEYGFKDAFNQKKKWYSAAYLAIDQGPVISMIENYRTGLLWQLFMSSPEVHAGLQKLGFQSPYLNSGKH